MWSLSIMFPTLGLLCLLLFLPILGGTGSVIMELSFLPSEVTASVHLYVDQLSTCFSLIVFMVSSVVFLYFNTYMSGSISRLKFSTVMFVFAISIVLLSFSAELFWAMIGWDGLGLSSFLLITFFTNWNSFSSGVVTTMLNRVGDFFIVLAICFNLLSGQGGCWSGSFMFPILLLVSAITNSAQAPFSVWLPLAIAAPTPVSALVHSSTLVTAGVFLLLRFYKFLSPFEINLLNLISLSTCVVAFLGSVSEVDLKKVIALSTLFHVGVIMFYISTDSVTSANVHILSHSFFKSTLFMVAGVIIHSNSNSQDLRKVSLPWQSLPVSTSLVFCIVSMVGGPFLAGFYSKEVLLSTASQSIVVADFLFVVFAVFSSSFYSFRIVNLLLSYPPSIGASTGENWSPVLMIGLSISTSAWIIIPEVVDLDYVASFGSQMLKICSFTVLGVSAVIGAMYVSIPSLKLGNWLSLSLYMWGIPSLFYFLGEKVCLSSVKSMNVVDVKGAVDAWALYWSQELWKNGKALLENSSISALFDIGLIILLFLTFFILR